MKKTTFKVLHLDCQSCAMMMEGVCEEIEGVEKAEVNSRQRRLVVEHDEAVHPSVVSKALADEGYPVEEA